jgi:hypothetical protein
MAEAPGNEKLRLYGRMVPAGDYEALKRLTDVLVMKTRAGLALAYVRRRCLSHAIVALSFARNL